MPVVSVKIGDHCYHGLCDIGSSMSAIPFTLYQEIMDDIAPAEIEDMIALLVCLKYYYFYINVKLLY